MKKLYIGLLVFVLAIGIHSLHAQSYVGFYTSYPYECGPVNVSFTNSSFLVDTVGPVHYEWYINDKLYSTEHTPPDTLLPGGYHHITLWIWDQSGFSGDNYEDIYIPGLGNIRTMPEDICPGEEVRFHLEGNSDWIIWKFPDGTTSNNWEETFVFDSAATYTVKALGSTWECGLDSTSAEIIVDDGAQPRAEIWVNGTWFCPNDKVKFSSPEAASHRWEITKGTVTDTLFGQDIFYAFADTGEYTVSLTTSNGCDNTNTVSEMIYIGTDSYPNAWFDIDYMDNPPCPNYEIKFNAQGEGQYEWDFGDGSFASERTVYNTYSAPGTYTVQLVVRNGCGFTDTVTQEVYVEYMMESTPGVEIRFKDKDSYISMVNVCPGTEVHLESEIWNSDDDVTLSWYVNDVYISHSENLIHNFTQVGENEIKLVATNKCMASDSAYKYVFVDDLMAPVNSALMASPMEICPGEEVYFWSEGDHDDWNTDYIQKLIYNIDFGDSQSMNGITGQTVDFPPVLAAHEYPTAGSYHFVFTAENTCGIKDTLEGDILVDMDQTRDPFYYVGNSTVGDDDQGAMEDWSLPVANAHEFVIPIDLFNWNYLTPMDSTVYIFMWYGNIDPTGDPGPPDGMVEVKAPDTISVYVPYNVLEPSVGIAVVWYCNPGEFDGDVQLHTLPLTSSMEEIQSFPLEKAGFTDLLAYPDISGALTLDGMMWDGICPAPKNKLRSRWYYQADQGYYVALGIWDQDGDTLYYDISYGSDKWNTSSFVSSGSLVQIMDSTLYFTQTNGQLCVDPINFEYTYSIDEGTDQLTLYSMSDNCGDRITFLTSKPFIRDDENWDYDYEKDRSGCPGDSIELYIAGGSSYEWQLHDGTITNESHFYHAYTDTGTYKELVIATNACGRVDSIYTTVYISNTNVPEAFWYADRWDARRMEPIQFMYEDDNDDFGNNEYLWNFGDGTTSTEKDPSHYYTKEGDYDVTLTVTNGCGSSQQTQTIWIKQELASCIAKFTFDIIDKKVTFYNNSVGEISSYYWDFGNGKVSQLKNPVHTYQNYGVYEVTLIVHDTLTQCSDEISLMITVGEVGCFADFKYQVNETNQNVLFTDQSLGEITSWYWDFGDGTFATDTMPVHYYPTMGIYNVCLTIRSNTTGCISQVCKKITIGQVDIIADFNHFIDPESGNVEFTDISEGEITNWYWEFGDGMWDTIPNTSHQYAQSGEYEVCLSVFNELTGSFDGVCKNIDVVTDTSQLVTKAKFNYFVDPATRNVQFIDASSGEIDSWYWTFGDGTFATGDSVNHTYPVPGFYNVCLTVFNAGTGERSEACKTIQVGALSCNINADFGYYINPNTNEVSFNDKSTGAVNAWFWDFGDGKTSSRKSPKHIYTQPGLYLVSLGVRDTVNNCNDYHATFIQVGAAECIADFRFTVTDTATNTVKFTNNSIGNIESYFWYFDDGTYETGENPIHSYNSPGLYSVSLTITDASGFCFDFRIKDIQVGTIDCDATFTAYIDSTSNTAYFTNSSVGSATDYYWLFGDGRYHIGPSPVHTYPAPGYYTASLNTYNQSNGCFDYFENVILIGNSANDVEADFFYQADFSNGSVKFFNESLGENLSYIWDFGDGTTATEENPTHIYSNGGYQFVCLTATNTMTNAVKTTCKLIQTSNLAAENCLANFKYQIDTSLLQVQFIDKSYGDPDTYQWVFGDGNTSTDAEPLHQYTEAGFYLVELSTVNSTTGCESKTAEYINVGVQNNSIKAAFTYELDTTALGKPGGKPVDILGVGHGGGSKLSWSFGDATKAETKAVNSTTLRPRHEYAEGGRYEVCLTISDDLIGQSDTYCDDVLVPYETFITENICEGDEYDLFGTLYSTAGDYEGSTITSDGIDSTVYVTLNVNPVPTQPSITVDGYTLTATSASAYQWYRDNVAIDGATSQTYSATTSGDYTVVVYNEYDCPSTPSNAQTVVGSGIEDLDELNIQIFPNPMQAFTTINYNLLKTGQINISIIDASGNQIETLINTYKPAGDHQIIWRDPGLASGIYYIVFKTDHQLVTKKLMIQK